MCRGAVPRRNLTRHSPQIKPNTRFKKISASRLRQRLYSCKIFECRMWLALIFLWNCSATTARGSLKRKLPAGKLNTEHRKPKCLKNNLSVLDIAPTRTTLLCSTPWRTTRSTRAPSDLYTSWSTSRTLNRRAFTGELELTAVSIHAYAHL